MLLQEEIKKLVALQKIDSEIYAINEEKNTAMPERLNALNADLTQKKQSLKDAEEAVKTAQLHKKERELELAAKEEGAKKAEGALYQLKSNKEYQAKLNEISSLKADISLYEEEVLKGIEAIEKADAALKIARETFSGEEKSLNSEITAVNTQINELAVKVKELEGRRQIAAKEIDHDILTRYENLLKKRSGFAITAINTNECCAYCHMKVTAQQINEIKMLKDLVFCSSCNRILYIPEDIDNG